MAVNKSASYGELKLDFNERSDSKPLWLAGVKANVKNYWKYPNKDQLETLIAQQYQMSREEILLTNGGDEAIELMFKFAKLNDLKLILPLPAFSQYWNGKDIWQIEAKVIEPLDSLNIDQEATLNAIENNSIVIITSPNNPTGETISSAHLARICQQAQAKGAYVFLDCAYVEFTDLERSYFELINQFDNLLMLRTLSKAYGLAAIRVGYLLGQKNIVSQYKKLALPFNLSQPNMQIAQAAFTQAATLEVRNYCLQIKQNREQLVSYLSKFGLNINDSQANFILIRGSKKRLKMIVAACKLFNIQVKTSLLGLSERKTIEAIRVAIPFYLERLLSAFKLALEPELICFDMDGVLIDTSDSYDQAIAKTFEYFSEKTIAPKQIADTRAQGGLNNDWVLTQALLEQSGLTIELETIKQVFQQYYLGSESQEGLFNKETPFINRTVSDQIFISRSKTIKTAIVTGRGRNEAEQGLNLITVSNTLLVSDDDVDVSKPSPEGIKKAKSYYGCNLAWMLGDAPDDMLAAKSAGALAIGIGDEKLYEFGADIVLDNVNELEELL
ncbi:MAG: aminotransferase class I/II-fold pyridoxal phosphate-dependent enzyme [Gammaproteobacteria bacterium]|nr:aminotransferase class I/II-fold pyridoxal phosphate-dependent enzyme [Gammaproteobacteria bacterium]